MKVYWLTKRTATDKLCAIKDDMFIGPNYVDLIVSYIRCMYITVCPRSSDPFYTVSYYIDWVTIS